MRISVLSQLKKFYVVKESPSFDTIHFYLKATAANYLIKQSAKDHNPLSIYGNLDLGKINPSFKSKIVNNTCYAKLQLDEYTSAGFRDRFPFDINQRNENHNFWRMSFSTNKIYRLDLHYGFGNADVDLTGAPIQQFMLYSGNADVMIEYEDGYFNPIKMDTFFVKADFGSIVAKNMEFARSKNMIIKLGFGNMLLDFESGISETCKVNASIGAGNLEIVLPHESHPVIIYVKDSPLCAITLTQDFEEVETNVFINKAYSVNANDILAFDVDVALGQIKFVHND